METEALLDDTIFKRVKADEDRDAAWLEDLRQRDDDLLKVSELIVDGDTQGLKDKRSRVDRSLRPLRPRSPDHSEDKVA